MDSSQADRAHRHPKLLLQPFVLVRTWPRRRHIAALCSHIKGRRKPARSDDSYDITQPAILPPKHKQKDKRLSNQLAAKPKPTLLSPPSSRPIAAAGMACLQLSRAGISPALGLLSVPPRRRRRCFSPLHFRCRLEGGDADSRGEEPPESLFMKELKRRGMNKTSLLDDAGRGVPELEEELEETERRSASNAKLKGAVSTEYGQGLSNQRERSMALNSEGLEGLIPRAKLLLTVGGTFFLGFWPLIMITIALFAALYFYFGPSFVHDASKLPPTPPPYIDPYALLEDERLSQSSAGLN